MRYTSRIIVSLFIIFLAGRSTEAGCGSRWDFSGEDSAGTHQCLSPGSSFVKRVFWSISWKDGQTEERYVLDSGGRVSTRKSSNIAKPATQLSIHRISITRGRGRISTRSPIREKSMTATHPAEPNHLGGCTDTPTPALANASPSRIS